jgi:hypothetical protein
VGNVTVYRYMVIDTNRGEKRKSRRWGTRGGIESLGEYAEILEFTATEVDASAVDSLGFTKLDFDPSSG